jgi:hypothetical protein
MKNDDKQRDWVIGKDDTGTAVLQWTAPTDTLGRAEDDPLARTYNFLERLDVPDLKIADEAPPEDGFNPYESGVYALRRGHRRAR